MTPLTDAEILAFCNSLASTTYIYYPIVKDFSNDLLKTGCRPSELLETDRWVENGDNTMTLTPLKRNRDRIIPKEFLTLGWFQAKKDGYPPYQSLTLRQLEWVNKKLIGVNFVMGNNRSAISYIFRYNFIRQLSITGATDEEIRDYMGWKSNTMPATYLGTSIYTIP